MGKQLISVLMPVFNAELYLVESIRSVLDQDYGEIEFIIVDDGSTDGSQEIIRKFEKEDNRILYLKKENNSGIVDTLHYGLEYVSGDYVARMDADDICMHNRLSRQMIFMENNSLDICGSGVKCFGMSHSIKKYPETHDELITNLFLYGSTIAHPTALFKTEVLHNQPYSDKFLWAEDYALWLDIGFSSNYRLGNCPEILLSYRVHEKQASTAYRVKQKQSTKKACDYFLTKQFGLFTDQELEANYILSREHKKGTFQNIIDYGSLVEKVITVVEKNKISRKFLDKRLYHVCKKNAFHGSIIGNLFLKNAESPLVRQRAWFAIMAMLKKYKKWRL